MGEASAHLTWRSGAQKRRLSGGLRRVEARLEHVAAVFPGQLRASAVATLSAGGKRLRPLLVLLSARRDAPLTGSVVHAAVAVELLHVASLLHDDVLDGAMLRRGRPTVASESGVHVATSVGNYLLARAFTEVVSIGDALLVDKLSEAAAGLSEGEVLQMNEANVATLSPEAYIRRCALKTGGLFAASCGVGALATHVDDESVGELERFGRLLGLAFQIFDDILDFTGDEAMTGKQVGTDVRDGTMTLPLIFAVGANPGLADIVRRRDKDEASVADVVDAVRHCGALDQAREVALGYIAQARDHLSACCDEVEKDLLSDLAGRVVDRYC